MRVAFITNFCPHYRVRTFETLARRCDVDFYFFSRGDEWYWQREHGIHGGEFKFEYLDGFRLGRTRVTPALLSRLWQGRYDVIVKCINGRFALPATYSLARLRGVPLVLWTELWSRVATPFHILASPLTRHLYRSVEAIVVPGDNVRTYLQGLGVRPDKLFVAPHCVDNDFYRRPVLPEELDSLRALLAIPAGTRVILYLGRLEASKGLTYLIDAFAALADKDAILVLAGQGTLRAALEEQVGRLRLEARVRFPGYVRQEDTPSYFALAHVAVLPSITTRAGREPWGLTVNEAMNQGVPVVASEAVGAVAGGLVRDGFSGFVVPEKDSLVLSERLGRLLRDTDLRDEMGRKGRDQVMAWNNEAMVSGFCEAIEYVRSRRGPSRFESGGIRVARGGA